MDRRDEPKAKGAATLRVLCKALTIAAAVTGLILLMPGILRQTVSTTHAIQVTPVNAVERTAQPGMPETPITWASGVWRDPSGTGEWESDGGYWYWLEAQPANPLAAP